MADPNRNDPQLTKLSPKISSFARLTKFLDENFEGDGNTPQEKLVTTTKKIRTIVTEGVSEHNRQKHQMDLLEALEGDIPIRQLGIDFSDPTSIKNAADKALLAKLLGEKVNSKNLPQDAESLEARLKQELTNRGIEEGALKDMQNWMAMRFFFNMQKEAELEVMANKEKIAREIEEKTKKLEDRDKDYKAVAGIATDELKNTVEGGAIDKEQLKDLQKGKTGKQISDGLYLTSNKDGTHFVTLTKFGDNNIDKTIELFADRKQINWHNIPDDPADLRKKIELKTLKAGKRVGFDGQETMLSKTRPMDGSPSQWLVNLMDPKTPEEELPEKNKKARTLKEHLKESVRFDKRDLTKSLVTTGKNLAKKLFKGDLTRGLSKSTPGIRKKNREKLLGGPDGIFTLKDLWKDVRKKASAGDPHIQNRVLRCLTDEQVEELKLEQVATRDKLKTEIKKLEEIEGRALSEEEKIQLAKHKKGLKNIQEEHMLMLLAKHGGDETKITPDEKKSWDSRETAFENKVEHAIHLRKIKLLQKPARNETEDEKKTRVYRSKSAVANYARILKEKAQDKADDIFKENYGSPDSISKFTDDTLVFQVTERKELEEKIQNLETAKNGDEERGIDRRQLTGEEEKQLESYRDQMYALQEAELDLLLLKVGKDDMPGTNEFLEWEGGVKDYESKLECAIRLREIKKLSATPEGETEDAKMQRGIDIRKEIALHAQKLIQDKGRIEAEKKFKKHIGGNVFGEIKDFVKVATDLQNKKREVLNKKITELLESESGVTEEDENQLMLYDNQLYEMTQTQLDLFLLEHSIDNILENIGDEKYQAWDSQAKSFENTIKHSALTRKIKMFSVAPNNEEGKAKIERESQLKDTREKYAKALYEHHDTRDEKEKEKVESLFEKHSGIDNDEERESMLNEANDEVNNNRQVNN